MAAYAFLQDSCYEDWQIPGYFASILEGHPNLSDLFVRYSLSPELVLILYSKQLSASNKIQTLYSSSHGRKTPTASEISGREG